MTNSTIQQKAEELIHDFEQLEQLPISQTWKTQLVHKMAETKQAQPLSTQSFNLVLLVLVLLNVGLIYSSFTKEKQHRQQDLSLISSEFLSYSSNSNNR